MIHGGDIYTEGLLKGKELLDYSSNINPLGIPNSFKNNIDKAVENLVRYPDIKYRKLRKALSEYNDVPDNYFLLGNGAAEIIDLTISMMNKILIAVPSFSEYEIDAEKWGCDIEYSYLKHEINSDNIEHNEDGKDKLLYDYKDITNKLKHAECMIIGNPNNPNGCIIDKQNFREVLDYCENNNKIIIIDEAFIEFTGNIQDSFIDKIKHYKCLIIIRALTKFFGMPGIRFGYGISSNLELLNKIRKKQNPWNINCFAELAAECVLKDEQYIKGTINWMIEEREYFTAKLNKIDFIDKVYYTKANYVLCQLKKIDCSNLYDMCMKHGIVIRKADNYRGLDESFVRFAIKDRESNEKFLLVLKEIEKINTK